MNTFIVEDTHLGYLLLQLCSHCSSISNQIRQQQNDPNQNKWHGNAGGECLIAISMWGFFIIEIKNWEI